MLRRVLGGALAVALLAGCGPSEADERAAVLEEAVAETFTGPVAFNLALDADEQALASFGEDAGPLSSLLASSSVAGVIEEDRLAVGVRLADVDALQARSVGPGELYVRVDLNGLAELVLGAAPELEVELRRALRREGADEATQDAVLAAVRGEWVLLAAGDDEASASTGSDGSAGEELARLLRAALATARPVDHIGTLSSVPFDGQLTVELDVVQLLLTLADEVGVEPGATAGPGALTARVTITGGVVRTVLVDADPLLPGLEGAELVLDLRQLGAGEQLVRAPEDAVRLTTEQLQRAAALLPTLGADTP